MAKKTVKKPKDRPRYKILEEYQSEFKNEFKIVLNNFKKNITQILDEKI